MSLYSVQVLGNNNVPMCHLSVQYHELTVSSGNSTPSQNFHATKCAKKTTTTNACFGRLCHFHGNGHRNFLKDVVPTCIGATEPNRMKVLACTRSMLDRLKYFSPKSTYSMRAYKQEQILFRPESSASHFESRCTGRRLKWSVPEDRLKRSFTSLVLTDT